MSVVAVHAQTGRICKALPIRLALYASFSSSGWFCHDRGSRCRNQSASAPVSPVGLPGVSSLPQRRCGLAQETRWFAYLHRLDQPLVCGFFLSAALIIRQQMRPPKSYPSISSSVLILRPNFGSRGFQFPTCWVG
jgi:hypothetical protein